MCFKDVQLKAILKMFLDCATTSLTGADTLYVFHGRHKSRIEAPHIEVCDLNNRNSSTELTGFIIPTLFI
jgi:hypothetical protein